MFVPGSDDEVVDTTVRMLQKSAAIMVDTRHEIIQVWNAPTPRKIKCPAEIRQRMIKRYCNLHRPGPQILLENVADGHIG